MKIFSLALIFALFQSCGYLKKDPNARLIGANWQFETIEAPMKFYSGIQYAQSCAEAVNGVLSPIRYASNPNWDTFQQIRYSMTNGGVNETMSGPNAMLTYWFFAETMCRNTINSNGGSLLGLNLNRNPSSIPNNEVDEFINRIMYNAFGYNDPTEAAIIKNFINTNAAQFNALTPGSARNLYKQACVLVLLSIGMNGV